MSVVGLFQEFQRIYGYCPCCGEPFRLSDATLFCRSPPPRTPWDDLEQAWTRLRRAEERLLDEEVQIRQEAVEKGQKERDRRLRALTSFFRRHKIALRDVKLLFHPVNYVAFHGLTKSRCRAVEFLDCEPASALHERLQRSIGRTIEAGNYSWITMHIQDDGRVSCV